MYQGKIELSFKIMRLLRLTKVVRQLDVHNNVRNARCILALFFCSYVRRVDRSLKSLLK